MPELPEVEVVRTRLEHEIVGQKIISAVVHNPPLRLHRKKVNENLIRMADGQTVTALQRRSKSLIFQTQRGFLLSHLGMSGRWRIVSKDSEPIKHDHIELKFADFCLRYNDYRKFGYFEWIDGNATTYDGFAKLGREPIENPAFSHRFDACFLKDAFSNRKSVSIKSALMSNKEVAGIGNIYTNETLFIAGIHPERSAHTIELGRLESLCQAIIEVLQQAITAGGTTLRQTSYVNLDGRKGSFQHSLKVYGRESQPCTQCDQPIIKKIKRSKEEQPTFYCSNCQT